MPFQKGQSGNPAGRPKGSKHKIQESFLKDFLQVWTEGGLAAIDYLAEKDQATFVRVAAGLLPKEENHTHEVTGARWLTEAEWRELITTLEDNSEPTTQETNDGLASWPTDGQAKQ